MNIYKDNNVYDEAKKRISFLFDEFETVVVSMSGGKDSTVVYELCLAEAKKRKRLPLPVLFIDQEAEWENTIKYVKSIMYREDVQPYWLQVPIKLFNATSHESDNWLHCWAENEKWMREKDPISIKENDYGTDRFKYLFPAFMRKTYKGKLDKVCAVGGVRCEESPGRRKGLTSMATYKYITWGNAEGKVLTFYPIYDWSYTDVWHAIASNKWRYNAVYDGMYRLGVKDANMRVSNLNHETALMNITLIQEIEPQLWNKLTKRLYGMNSAKQNSFKETFSCPKELPFMFSSWKEYRDYLLENIVKDEEQRKSFKKDFESYDKNFYGDPEIMDKVYRGEISSILANDWTGTKMRNFASNPDVALYVNIRKGKKWKGLYQPKILAEIERIEDELNEGKD